MVKNQPASAGNIRDARSIPGSGRSPGVGNGNLFLYSCLENSMDRGAWWASVQGGHKETDMTECMHACTHTHTHSYSNLETGLILPTISKWHLSISLYYVVSQYPLEYL